jgi:hypothetical protein
MEWQPDLLIIEFILADLNRLSDCLESRVLRKFVSPEMKLPETPFRGNFVRWPVFQRSDHFRVGGKPEEHHIEHSAS